MTIGKRLYTVEIPSYSFLLEDKKLAKEQYTANCNNVQPVKLNSLLCALLLSSGRIISSAHSPSYFRFTFKAGHIDWARSCYQQLQNYLPGLTIEEQHTTDTRSVQGFTERIVIQSTSCTMADELYATWYRKDIKRVPLEFIEEYITDRTLAW